MYKKTSGASLGLKSVLAIICGLIVGSVLFACGYPVGGTISSLIMSILIGFFTKERTEHTGVGKTIGFIIGFFAFCVYIGVLILTLEFVMPIAIVLYFTPYVLLAYILINRESEESKSPVTFSEQRNVTVFPNSNEVDLYFVDAGRFIIEKNKASIGMLQRVYKIGFNRAARIMDQLCEAGVVGEENGTAPRTVLMSLHEFNDYLKAKEYI